ncbi:hypothetical protein [Symbioplanes lichenis]|uniref:DUF7919 family protein n=1 Tax=Symbioplanes lichenis TaxID=1629072 RepID=UPI002738B1E5|nr:hypothetical protein [Actinoplanes lichenis]
MTHFEDLAAYAYQDEETLSLDDGYLVYRPRYARLAVGWLDPAFPFPTGPAPEGFAAALLDIVAGRRVNAMRGWQDCPFCPAPSPRRAVEAPHPSGPVFLGNAEIRVPGGPGKMYAAPNLIWHYVTAHDYRPPEVFVAAVERYDPAWTSGAWIPDDAERE